MPTDRPPIEYLAGILDANAIFRVRRTAEGTDLPVVALHGLATPVLDMFAEATGTKVTLVHRDYNRAPCADHCTQRHQHIASVTGRWSVTGAKATVLIAAVLPSLRVQPAEARAALDVGLAAPRKPGTIFKMSALGWPTSIFDDVEPRLRDTLHLLPVEELDPDSNSA